MQTLLAHLLGQLLPTPGSLESGGILLQWSRAHMMVLNRGSGQRVVFDRGHSGLVRLSRSVREVSGGWVGRLVGRNSLNQHWLQVELELGSGDWLRLCSRSTHPELLDGLEERAVSTELNVDFAPLIHALEALCALGAKLDSGLPLPVEISAMQRLETLEAEHRATVNELERLRSIQQRTKDKVTVFESRENSRVIELATLRAELHLTSQELEALRLKPSGTTSAMSTAAAAVEAYHCPSCEAVGHAIQVRFGRWIPADGEAPLELAMCPLCWRSFSASG